MATLTVYTLPHCLDCGAVKNLLRGADVAFREVDISRVPRSRDALEMLSGLRSVPQVFIGSRFLGQVSEIRYLVESGKIKDVVEQRGRPH